MKESVKIIEQIGRSDGWIRLKTVGWHSAAAVSGWIASRAVLKGGILPFGLSFLGGMPVAYTPAAAIGVFLGYFFPAITGGNFRYVAAMFILLSIKILLSSHKRIIENPFWLSLFCLGTELTTVFVSLAQLNTPLPVLISEVLLSSGGTYFVTRSAAALSVRPAGLSAEELSALFVTVNILLLGLQQPTLGGISLGRILSALFLLICAKYGATLSGAIAGITVAFSGLLCGNDPALCVSFALAGLLAGVFTCYGKYAQIGGMLAATVVGVLTTGISTKASLQIIETLCGAILFLLLPRSAGVLFGRLFCAMPQILTHSGLRKAVSLRLELSAGALNDISQTVDRVAEELGRINTPDYSQMIAAIEDETCAGCKLRKHCWESRRSATLAAVLELTKAVKCGESDLLAVLPSEFRERCLHTTDLCRSVSRNYTNYAAQIAAEKRIDEVRTVLSDQFESIAGLLTDLRFDLEREERFDHAMALNVAAALRNLNLRAEECSCTVDQFGRITVRVKLTKNKDTVINKRQIMKAISLVSERDFDVPTVTEVGGDIFIHISERTVLDVQTGIAQHCARGATLCGDTCREFYDGTGHYYLLLSDGMGTGGRAAVDSTMTAGLMARLLRAGFGFDCALRVLNSAMLFKSSDESLATVDLARIDLFNGDTRLYKAGGAQTVVRKGNRTGVAESHSLPIGILRDVGFDKLSVRLHTGDILLLLSDGATADGTDWIERITAEWGDGSADDLAQKICDEARRRQPADHDDDITVIATILRRNL